MRAPYGAHDLRKRRRANPRTAPRGTDTKRKSLSPPATSPYVTAIRPSAKPSSPTP
ncbi:hypothetical protein GCM10010295_26740 [Streptomyces intermedius]